jgi:hypothetical protein
MRRLALASAMLGVLVLTSADAPIAAGAVVTPTSLTTTLEVKGGGGKRSERIRVEEGEGVDDKAELSGENALIAGGTVHYKVYSDRRCTKLVREEGREVSRGAVAPSEFLKLSAGTYFWQASYSGDENNQASTSKCGSEVEKVIGRHHKR